MIEVKRILCPFDFSEFSRHALDHAIRLAQWYEADIDVFHVFATVPPPAMLSEYPGTMRLDQPAREQLLEEARRFAEPVMAAGIPVTTTVAEGDTVGEILKRAQETSTDFIVIGTHGAGGFERLLLGSISEKILRKAPCPVLTIPPTDATLPAPQEVIFKRIVCPVDFSEPSMCALSYALSLAEEADGRLALVHVLEWFADTEPRDYGQVSVPEYRRVVERDARERLRNAVPDEARQWCEAHEVLVTGKPHREIIAMAKATAAELIVMGVHGRGAIDLMLFGSTTHHVVRAATCPVLTVRQAGTWTPSADDGNALIPRSRQLGA